MWDKKIQTVIFVSKKICSDKLCMFIFLLGKLFVEVSLPMKYNEYFTPRKLPAIRFHTFKLMMSINREAEHFGREAPPVRPTRSKP